MQAAKTSPAQLAHSTKQFGGVYGDVLQAGMGMAGQTQVRRGGYTGRGRGIGGRDGDTGRG